jgi:hypothetical protein
MKTCRLIRRFALPKWFDFLNENMPAHQEVRPPNQNKLISQYYAYVQ